jgi:hypothetical protein
MPSIILYDNRDNEIKRCQTEPHGSAGMPSFEGLCKSARIPEDEKEYMDTCIIDSNMLTNQAKYELRIVETMQEVEEEYQREETDPEGDTYQVTDTSIVEKLLPAAIKKPELTINTNVSEVSISTNPIFTVEVGIQNIIETDNFTSVAMTINGVEFFIPIIDNNGSKQIELSEADTYIIAYDDDRFISETVEVVAVE